MIRPSQILKRSSKLSIANIGGVLLSVPAGFYATARLGPEAYASVSFVLLGLSYASLVRPGTLEGGMRQMVDRLGKGDETGAGEEQNSSFTAELLWAAFPAMGLLAASFLFPDPIRRFGLAFVPLTYVGSTLSRILMSGFYAHQRFEAATRIVVVRSVAAPLLLCVLVSRFGAYGYFAASAAVEWGVVALFAMTRPALGIRWRLVARDVRRLTLIGLPLSLQGLVYWAYRLAGQTSVAAWLPLPALAYYGFSASVVNLAMRGFGDFSGVLTPVLWREMARTKDPWAHSAMTADIGLGMALVACAVANLAQAGFGPMVRLILPKYLPAIPVFEVLAFNVVLLTLAMVPSLVLDSSAVNRQWGHLRIWAVALVINYILNFAAAKLDGGIIAIAWNDVLVQTGVVIAIYSTAQQYLFERSEDAWRLYRRIAVPVMVAALVFALLRHATVDVPDETGALILYGFARVTMVLLVWAAVGRAVYGRFQRRIHQIVEAESVPVPAT